MTLLRPSDKKIMKIQWNNGPGLWDYEAIENCEIKKLEEVYRPDPGTTVTKNRDYTVVNLENLCKFFDNGVKLELDKKRKILYIIHKSGF